MTVASRPVLGSTACVTASAATSMPSSGTRTTQICSGLSPEQWQATPTQWPSPYVALGAATGDDEVAGGPPPTDSGCTPTVVTAPTTPTTPTSLRQSRYSYGSTRLQPGTTGTTTTTQCGTGTPTSSGSTGSTGSSGGSSLLWSYRQQMLARSGGTTSGSTTPTTTFAAPPTSTLSAPTTTTSSTSTTSLSGGSLLSGSTSTIGTRRGSTTLGSPTTTTTTPPVTDTPIATPIGQGPQATPYHCTTTGFGGGTFGKMSMMDVLNAGAGSSLNMCGRYMVAALLNARSGRTPVLDEAGVRNMWNDLVNRGYFEPTAGIRWTANEIVAYLKTTMG